MENHKTLISNETVISNVFKLAQTLNNHFKSAVGKLEIKECEASSGVNANSRSKDGVVAILTPKKAGTLENIAYGST